MSVNAGNTAIAGIESHNFTPLTRSEGPGNWQGPIHHAWPLLWELWRPLEDFRSSNLLEFHFQQRFGSGRSTQNGQVRPCMENELICGTWIKSVDGHFKSVSEGSKRHLLWALSSAAGHSNQPFLVFMVVLICIHLIDGSHGDRTLHRDGAQITAKLQPIQLHLTIHGFCRCDQLILGPNLWEAGGHAGSPSTPVGPKAVLPNAQRSCVVAVPPEG